MNHEMMVNLSRTLGKAAEYRARGDQFSAEFLEETVFDYCLGNWEMELMNNKEYFDGVDRRTEQEKKKARMGHLLNRM